MTRLMTGAPIALGAFALMLALAALAVRAGLLPHDTVTLWSGAVTAGGGEVPIGRIVAAYPSIPFLATTILELIAPSGTPTPMLLAAALAAALAVTWFAALRQAGQPLAAAATTMLLLAFHPALVRAMVGGPAEMFLAIFLYLLAGALYDLRRRNTVSDVMAVGLALLGLSFSHPMGAAISIAVVPFLVFAVRPVLVANSAFNVVIALVFPAVFAAAAYCYVSWVFPGAGWSFVTAPAATLAVWNAGMSNFFGGAFTGSRALDAGIVTALALWLGAPVAVVALRLVSRRRPLIAPAAVMAAGVVMAAVMAVATGLFGEPAAVAVAAPTLAAIVVTRVKEICARPARVVALVVAGWLGGVAAVALIDPATAARVQTLLAGQPADHEQVDALDLGGATRGRDGVLVDSFNAPAVVIGRGRAHGLLSPAGEAFSLSVLFARLDAPFVAVPNPASVVGAIDQLNKVFPLLYRRGAPGYRLIYQNKTWRLYERLRHTLVYKD